MNDLCVLNHYAARAACAACAAGSCSATAATTAAAPARSACRVAARGCTGSPTATRTDNAVQATCLPCYRRDRRWRTLRSRPAAFTGGLTKGTAVPSCAAVSRCWRCARLSNRKGIASATTTAAVM